MIATFLCALLVAFFVLLKPFSTTPHWTEVWAIINIDETIPPVPKAWRRNAEGQWPVLIRSPRLRENGVYWIPLEWLPDETDPDGMIWLELFRRALRRGERGEVLSYR